MAEFGKLQEVIASTLNIDKDSVTEDLAVGSIPQWDSMGNLAIISAVEEAFGIEFPMEDLFDLNSVRALMDELNKLEVD